MDVNELDAFQHLEVTTMEDEGNNEMDTDELVEEASSSPSDTAAFGALVEACNNNNAGGNDNADTAMNEDDTELDASPPKAEDDVFVDSKVETTNAPQEPEETIAASSFDAAAAAVEACNNTDVITRGRNKLFNEEKIELVARSDSRSVSRSPGGKVTIEVSRANSYVGETYYFSDVLLN